MSITKKEKDNAVDLLVTLIVDELSRDLNVLPDEMFAKFVSSKTGNLLYDENSDLWCSGPSDIADMFKKESFRK